MQGEVFDRNNPELDRKLLITTDYDKIVWLAEKIECAMKYYKEARIKITTNYV